MDFAGSVSSFDFLGGTGGQDGLGTSFNDQGLIVYTLYFNGDTSSGIFTSQIAPVPEPGTILAMGAGMLGLGRYLRRRRAAHGENVKLSM